MNKFTDVLISRHEFPRRWRTVAQGVILSLFASVATISSFLVIDIFVYGPFIHPNGLNPWQATWDMSRIPFALLFFVLYVLMLTSFAIVPTIIGGGIIGFILLTLARHNRLSMRTVLIAGVVVGLIAGWVTAMLVVPTISIGEWEPRVDPVLAGLVGMVAALFQSWLLSRWLKKRMT